MAGAVGSRIARFGGFGVFCYAAAALPLAGGGIPIRAWPPPVTRPPKAPERGPPNPPSLCTVIPHAAARHLPRQPARQTRQPHCRTGRLPLAAPGPAPCLACAQPSLSGAAAQAPPPVPRTETHLSPHHPTVLSSQPAGSNLSRQAQNRECRGTLPAWRAPSSYTQYPPKLSNP